MLKIESETPSTGSTHISLEGQPLDCVRRILLDGSENRWTATIEVTPSKMDIDVRAMVRSIKQVDRQGRASGELPTEHPLNGLVEIRVHIPHCNVHSTQIIDVRDGSNIRCMKLTLEATAPRCWEADIEVI